MNKQFHPIVGIDIGKLYSKVSAYNSLSQKVEILTGDSEQTEKGITPSLIAYHPGICKALIGWSAKRFLERSQKDACISGYDIQRYLFETNKEREQIRINFGDHWLLPQEAIALIIMKLKEIAETRIGDEVKGAVIAVPAYLKDPAKNVIANGAKLAGLVTFGILPEPLATELSYGLDMAETEGLHLVYDFGASYDATVIEARENGFKIMATTGDYRLGFDVRQKITAWITQQLLTQYGVDAQTDNSISHQIDNQVEMVLFHLDEQQRLTLKFSGLIPNQSTELNVPRSLIESVLDESINRSILLIDEMFERGIYTYYGERYPYSSSDISRILLAGGFCNIPKIKRTLLEHFGRDESFINTLLHPEHVVSGGAAFKASRFSFSEGTFYQFSDDEPEFRENQAKIRKLFASNSDTIEIS